MYQLARKFLFLFDAEQVHYFSMKALRLFCRWPFRIFLKGLSPSDAGPGREHMGLFFRNPIGLAAGFDKNAIWLKELEMLGFGFIEIGTVTPRPQEGNPKPRLFRLPEDKALLNRMGFNNAGVKTVADNLKKYHQYARKNGKRIIIGGNIGKNKDTANEEAWKDYAECFKTLFPYVDYFVVNVSSPNTPGLRELQQKDSIRKIIEPLHAINTAMTVQKPILVKIAPDISHGEMEDLASLALEMKWHGIIISNTTLAREGLRTGPAKLERLGAGGISGKPLGKRSSELIRLFHDKTEGKITIIGSGGVFSGQDAQEKLSSGASLLQVYTGFIYEGPAIVKKLCSALKT